MKAFMFARLLLSGSIWLASLFGAMAQTGTPKTPMALETEINNLWPDNTQNFITPFNARQTLLDMVASTSSALPPSGPTCSPPSLSTYQTFVNTTGAPTGTTFNIFDGTDCVLWGTLNQTAHQFAVTLGNPFAVADSYMAGAADSLFLGVRGNFSTPVNDDQATAIFQTVRNNTSTNGVVPTLYASTVKIGSGSNIINQAAQFEAVETAGNGGVAGAYGTGACTTASLGNCEGLVGIATATVAYSTLIGTEGNAINSSGTNQTTTFSSSSFNAGFMATCGGSNTCFAGFMTNPVSSSSTDVNGFYVSAATVSDTAFRNDASLVNGVDLSRGTYSGFAFKSPGFAISPSGQIVGGGTSNSTNGTLVLNGLTSGTMTLSASATGGHATYAGSGVAPTVTAGCNGTGGAISGTDISGTVGNQTASATSCTVTFGTAFSAAPRCVVSGHQVAPTTVVPSTGTLVINFTSTANAVFDWVCYGS
jgi:hypothetical protein